MAEHDEEKGPFWKWTNRVAKIATQGALCFRERNALIEQVRALRKEGKHDETKGLQPKFDENREKNRHITTEAEQFRREFNVEFPDRGDQYSFLAGVRKIAIANQFTYRVGKGKDAEMLNVASQVMWVVAPKDYDTFAFLRLRDRTGVNITEVNPDSLKRLIWATEKLLEKISEQLPDAEDVAAGVEMDFTTQQVVEEYDEISADLGNVNSILAKIEASRKRRQDQRGQQQDKGSGDDRKPVQTDPIAKLAGEIEEKKKAMQQAASGPKPNFARAAELQAEIETLNTQLETMRTDKADKDRMSGVAAMAGEASETDVPLVKLSGLVVVVEETREERPIEEAIELYETQITEMIEAEKEHLTEASTVEAEGDQIILEGDNKAKAGKKFMQAETSRTAAVQCRANVEKLEKMLKDMQSDLAQHTADQAAEAKQMVKDVAAKPAADAVVEPVEAEVAGTTPPVLETDGKVTAETSEPKAALAMQIVEAAKAGNVELIKELNATMALFA